MLAPPPNGDVYEFIAQAQTNPDAWGVVVAWDAYRTMLTEALPGFVADMTGTMGVAV